MSNINETEIASNFQRLMPTIEINGKLNTEHSNEKKTDFNKLNTDRKWNLNEIS